MTETVVFRAGVRGGFFFEFQTDFGEAPYPCFDPKLQHIKTGAGQTLEHIKSLGGCPAAFLHPVSISRLVDLDVDAVRLPLPLVFSAVLSSGQRSSTTIVHVQ